MRFGLTTEQQDLRDSVRRFLDRLPDGDDGSLLPLEPGTADWTVATEQLGLTALAVPEEFGGFGAGMVELAVVLEEMGRHLRPGPFLASSGLTVPALVACPGGEAGRYLPDIAAGRLLATLVMPIGRQGDSETPVRARERGSGFILTGTTAPVPVAPGVVVVPASSELGTRLFLVRPDAPGCSALPREPFDLTAPLACLELTEAPAVLVGEADDGTTVGRAFSRSRISLAASQLGGAQACLDTAVAYAKERSQFGRPIGSFQAIKHRLADVLVAVEGARSLVYYAAWLADHGDEADVARVASMAKAWCSDTYLDAAEAGLLVHGGLGFTWEHTAHLHLRRARSQHILLGHPDRQLDEVASCLGLGSSTSASGRA
ncbi:acyl-CoA dehydrogenase family protein [Streptomyces sp. NPDC055078]